MTFEFDADGFLTDRRGALEAGISRAHGALFMRGRQINRDCHELLFTADIRNRDVLHLLVAPLFIRALEHYQATLILLGMGLITPAKVLLRATVEAVFTTRAVARDEKVLKVFVDADLIERHRLMRIAQQNHHPNLRALREALTPELLNAIKEQINTSGARRLSAEELSKCAGMHEWYTTHYALLSKATHTSVRDLESYLSCDQSGEVRNLIYAPSMAEIPLLLLTATHCILLGAAAFTATFELDFETRGNAHLALIKADFQSLNGRDK